MVVLRERVVYGVCKKIQVGSPKQIHMMTLRQADVGMIMDPKGQRSRSRGYKNGWAWVALSLVPVQLQLNTVFCSSLYDEKGCTQQNAYLRQGSTVPFNYYHTDASTYQCYGVRLSQYGLPPKSSGLFRRSCATFLPNFVTRSSANADKPARRVQSLIQVMSRNIVPFHMLGIVSYQREIVTLSRFAVFSIFDFKNVATLKFWSELTQGHSKCYHSIQYIFDIVTMALSCRL